MKSFIGRVKCFVGLEKCFIGRGKCFIGHVSRVVLGRVKIS